MTAIIKGYKSAGDNYFIVELDIDIVNSLNNLNRSGVIDKNYAKYRCSKAYVNRIYNKFTNKETNVVASNYDPSFIYTKDAYVQVSDYEINDNVCANGIHFYLCKEAAYFHDLKSKLIENGKYKIWDDRNGRLIEECNYLNGKLNGLCQIYNEFNGALIKKYNCLNGELHGSFEEWDCNGLQLVKCNYLNGNMHGLYEEWDYNGSQRIKCFYFEGKRKNNTTDQCSEKNNIISQCTESIIYLSATAATILIVTFAIINFIKK